MNHLRIKRLKNEVDQLVEYPREGIMMEPFSLEIDECLKIWIKDKYYRFQIVEDYPFTAPIITDENGSLCHVRKNTIYSLRDIVEELYSKEEQKSIKDHFSFGKDNKSVLDKAGESKKVEVKSQSKKSKVFAEDVDPDLKDLYVGKPEKGLVSKKSKDNGSLEKKTGKSKFFEEEFGTDEADSTKKLEKKVKTDKKKIKKSIGKVTKKSIEKGSQVKKASFKFLEEDKISAQKSKSRKVSTKSKAKEETLEPVVKTKESISSVFEVEDDPYVLEIQTRKKKEAEKLAARTKVKTKGRKRESMARMAKFSQSLTGSQSQDECSQESSSDESAAKFKIPKLKEPRKKKESDCSQNSLFKQDVDTSKEKESNHELDEARDYTPSIDELLKLPDRPEDGGKTMDEVLDDLDIEIAERKKKHE